MEHFAFTIIVIVLFCVCQGQASVHVDVDVDVSLDHRNIWREGVLGKPKLTEKEDRHDVVSLVPQRYAQLLHKDSLDKEEPNPKEKTSSQRDDEGQMSSMVHQILSLTLKMEDRLDSLEKAMLHIESTSSKTENEMRAYIDAKSVEIKHQLTAFEETTEKHVERVEESLGLKIETYREKLTKELKAVVKLHERGQVKTGNYIPCNASDNIIELMENRLSSFEESLELYRESFSDQLNDSIALFNELTQTQVHKFQSTLDNKVSNAMLSLSSWINSTLKTNQNAKEIEHPDTVNVSNSSDNNETRVVNGSEIAVDQSNSDLPKPITCRKDAIDPNSSNISTYVVIPKSDSGDIGSAYLCDQVTDGGGWIVIQRRINKNVDFYLSWKEYKDGFGDLSGDFWLGNDLIHNITASGEFELRVEVSQGIRQAYALYNKFYIDNESERYTLHVSGYSGTARDSLSIYDGIRFSTWDMKPDSGCASGFCGGWWYRGCYKSDLNGCVTSWNSGPKWETFSYIYLQTTVMKIRKVG